MASQITESAYVQILSHGWKHPGSAVVGILLESETLPGLVDRVVPLLHTRATSPTVLTVGYGIAERVAKQIQSRIGGLYMALEKTPDPPRFLPNLKDIWTSFQESRPSNDPGVLWLVDLKLFEKQANCLFPIVKVSTDGVGQYGHYSVAVQGTGAFSSHNVLLSGKYHKVVDVEDFMDNPRLNPLSTVVPYLCYGPLSSKSKEENASPDAS